MRVLIIYASQYGSTKGIAERIADTLRDQHIDAQLAPAEAGSEALIGDGFDGFVIGSAVQGGHWLKPAIEFVRESAPIMARRPAWLFSSGPIGAQYVDRPQPEPKEIAEVRRLVNVQDHVVFAGSFDPKTADLGSAGWLVRHVAARFMPVGDFRQWDVIESWAAGIARELDGVLTG